MKIALFVSSWPPGSQANGIVTYAAQIVPALRRLGHEVFVVTPGKLDDDPQTIDLREFQAKPTVVARAYARLNPDAAVWRLTASALSGAIRYAVAKHDLEVFEIEESFGWSLAVSHRQLLPVVVRLHGPWFLNGMFDEQDFRGAPAASRRRQRWEARGIENAHFISSPSKTVLEAVKRNYRFNLPSCAVVPNPLDAVASQYIWSIERASADSLLFIGRFDKRKGGDLVLRVFVNLAELYPKLTLTMVGPDIGIRARDDKIILFKSFVQEFVPSHIRSRIKFCGSLNRAEIVKLRYRHFVTIVASQYEIMPYAVLEPMALGCPIVATDVGGISELIRNQQNGLLVPSQDADKMTTGLQTLA